MVGTIIKQRSINFFKDYDNHVTNLLPNGYSEVMPRGKKKVAIILNILTIFSFIISLHQISIPLPCSQVYFSSSL